MSCLIESVVVSDACCLRPKSLVLRPCFLPVGVYFSDTSTTVFPIHCVGSFWFRPLMLWIVSPCPDSSPASHPPRCLDPSASSSTLTSSRLSLATHQMNSTGPVADASRIFFLTLGYVHWFICQLSPPVSFFLVLPQY